MAKHRSNYLIDQLISNKLSRSELDEFLAGLHNEEAMQAYSEALETHFKTLLGQQENLPESAQNGT
ncbi:hypothetical protein [Spirosoma sp.]|uniref:hypothetical protein n=1 Tax=Spirosoma sp. TaxID=1899569 RepID=UPI003B3A355B